MYQQLSLMKRSVPQGEEPQRKGEAHFVSVMLRCKLDDPVMGLICTSVRSAHHCVVCMIDQVHVVFSHRG